MKLKPEDSSSASAAFVNRDESLKVIDHLNNVSNSNAAAGAAQTHIANNN